MSEEKSVKRDAQVEDNFEYPPLRVRILAMLAIALAFFLVALVPHTSSRATQAGCTDMDL